MTARPQRALWVLALCVSLAGCTDTEEGEVKVEDVRTQVLTRSVEGYGECTFVWFKDNDAFGQAVVLVGCDDG